MSFVEPGWLWALLLGPLLLMLFVRLEFKRSQLLRQWVAARLETKLLPAVSGWRRRTKVLLGLAGLLLLVIATARPQAGFVEEEITVRGRDVLIAFDVSKSMLANDISPDRLTRSKLAGEDLVNLLGGDRAGVIAFAGTAFLQAPLTVDHGAVLDTIRELTPDIIPHGGSNLAAALEVAMEAFGKGEGNSRALVFFSDGEELQADVAASARKAKEAGMVIFAAGVGTSQGSLIPVRDEHNRQDFVRDQSGQPVRSRLEEKTLTDIAAATGGRYFNLQNTPDIARALRASLESVALEDRGVAGNRRPVERYQWPLGAAVLVLTMGFFVRETRTLRKAVLLLAAVGMTGHAAADTARERFESGYNAYQEKDYARAVEDFGESVRARNPRMKSAAAYNLANSIVLQSNALEDIGEKIKVLEDAVGHYKEATRLNPENLKSDINRKRVEEFIEQLRELQKQQEEQKKKEEEKKEQEKEEDGEKKESGEDGEDGKDGQPKEDGDQEKPGENGDKQQESGQDGEEKKDAPGPVDGEDQKDLSGDLQSREQPGQEGDQQEMQEKPPQAEDGKISEAQARALLRALEKEEDKVQLLQQVPFAPVDKDW